MNAEIEEYRAKLRAMLPELAERYGVAELGLFGSRVRGDHRPDSDLDVLVTFKDGRGADWDDVFGLEDAIADLLKARIDLVVKKNLRARLRPYILNEVQRI